MIFRNGYISGFIDSLIDSLETPGHSSYLTSAISMLDYSIEQHPTFDPTLKISVPLCFIYLDNEIVGQNEDNSNENQLIINEANAYDFSLVLLDKFNNAASDLGVEFILASKAKMDEDNLNYPGTIIHDMSAETVTKSYIGQLPEGGYGEIQEVQYYKDHGIAAASQSLTANELNGISQTTIDSITTYYADINVFRVVLCNKLNTEIIMVFFLIMYL